MLLQSHSVNTSIESCTIHFLRWKESQSQLEKNVLCEWAFTLHFGTRIANQTLFLVLYMLWIHPMIKENDILSLVKTIVFLSTSSWRCSVKLEFSRSRINLGIDMHNKHTRICNRFVGRDLDVNTIDNGNKYVTTTDDKITPARAARNKIQRNNSDM